MFVQPMVYLNAFEQCSVSHIGYYALICLLSGLGIANDVDFDEWKAEKRGKAGSSDHLMKEMKTRQDSAV